jgi:hypothetical protein
LNFAGRMPVEGRVEEKRMGGYVKGVAGSRVGDGQKWHKHSGPQMPGPKAMGGG